MYIDEIDIERGNEPTYKSGYFLDLISCAFGIHSQINTEDKVKSVWYCPNCGRVLAIYDR